MTSRRDAPKRILVLGSTGRQGGGVVKALAHANSLLPPSSPNAWTILAVTRNATAPKAQRLLTLRGVQLVEGNLNDCPALFQAAGSDIYAVFSVQQGAENVDKGIVGKVRQAKALADAAKAHGVRHFVYSSVDFGGMEDTKVDYFEVKRDIETYIRSLALPHTILRVTGLMDCFLHEDEFPTKIYATIVTRCTYSNPATQTAQMICCEDIGKVTLHALEHPDIYLGQTLSLAGDELTVPSLLATYRRHTGRSLPTTFPFIVQAAKLFMPPLKRMCEFSDKGGFTVDIPALRKTFPDLKTWDEFVRTEMVPGGGEDGKGG